MNAPARGPTIQFGKTRITGAWAVLILSLMLASIVGALAVYARPALDWPMSVCVIIWLAFFIYWGKASKNSAPTIAQEPPKSRSYHELMLNLALILLVCPIPGLRRRLWPYSFALVLAGLWLQGAFFALAVWARRHLGRNWSGPIATKLDHQLIRSGPYRLIRHPIYTAMLGMFAASALVSGTVHAFVAFALVAFAYWRKIPAEERHLQTVFGDQWQSYQRRSTTLVPWLL